jgi:1-acyl-sn-glycerol-3-phosphate acyltransferase
VVVIRQLLLQLFIFPPLHLLYRLDVAGRDNVPADGPFVFAANHASHLDNALILLALPTGHRRRLGIAAAADTIFRHRAKGYLAALLGNAFPIARGGGSRWSVDYCRWLLHGGWSILLYPEGRLTVGGPTQPFRSGIGLLALAADVGVVPVRLDVVRRGIGEGSRLPRRGHVIVRFGAPLRFAPGTAVADAVARLQEAVVSL